MNFVEANDSILQRWEEHNEKCEKTMNQQDPKFASDGIMFRGVIDQNERYSDPEKENELW